MRGGPASHIDQGRRSRFPARVLLRPDRTRPDRTLRQYIRQIIHILWSVITFCPRGAKIK